jgi:polysaccharide export outer membrane protein
LQESRKSIPTYQPSYTPEDYRIQVGDQINIKVSTTDEESMKLFSTTSYLTNVNNTAYPSADLYNYNVYEDGTIDFLYVDSISVVGKTLREVKYEIEKALEPIVKISSVEVRLVNNSFSVIGKGGSGRYFINKEKLTIFQALAMSGDLDNYAERGQIKILRKTPSGTIIKTFDVRSKSVIQSEFYYVQPNDVIYVQAFNGQFFGIDSFPTIFTTLTSTASTGYLIFRIINLFK